MSLVHTRHFNLQVLAVIFMSFKKIFKFQLHKILILRKKKLNNALTAYFLTIFTL